MKLFGEPMKALSLTQPWATLIAIGAKRIETRSWSTRHRGDIAIHAAKGLGPVGGQRGLKEQCGVEPFCSVLNAAIKRHGAQYWQGEGVLKRHAEHPFMPLGAIVAVAHLNAVHETSLLLSHELEGHEKAFGNYEPGRFGWLLTNVRALPEPIPCRGALSLWSVPEDVEARVREQLKRVAQTSPTDTGS